MPTQRLNYIDALRGGAIFTVVYSHILIFCMTSYPESFVIRLLRLFYLNAFFFISGYLFYKPTETFNKEKVKRILIKKTTKILIPTIVMASIYWYSHGISMFMAIFDQAKMGYWFTFVLYEMFLLLACVMAILNHNHKKTETGILTVLGITSLVAFRIGDFESDAMGLLSAFNFCFYFPLFVLGMLGKKYNSKFQRLLDSKISFAFMFFMVMVSLVIKIPLFFVSVTVVLLSFGFAHRVEVTSPNFYRNGIGRILSLLGKFSMEIYLIHYFLLFEMPNFLSEYFKELSMSCRNVSFPEFLVVGSVALSICLGAITIAKILRKIPYVGSVLLGE